MPLAASVAGLSKQPTSAFTSSLSADGGGASSMLRASAVVATSMRPPVRQICQPIESASRPGSTGRATIASAACARWQRREDRTTAWSSAHRDARPRRLVLASPDRPPVEVYGAAVERQPLSARVEDPRCHCTRSGPELVGEGEEILGWHHLRGIDHDERRSGRRGERALDDGDRAARRVGAPKLDMRRGSDDRFDLRARSVASTTTRTTSLTGRTLARAI